MKHYGIFITILSLASSFTINNAKASSEIYRYIYYDSGNKSSTTANLPSVDAQNKITTPPTLMHTLSPTVHTNQSSTTANLTSIDVQNKTTTPSTFIHTLSPTIHTNHECHDDVSYQNPLNPGLSCDEHRYFDCGIWINIGMNQSQLSDLLQNCPDSCGLCQHSRNPSLSPSLSPSFSSYELSYNVYVNILVHNVQGLMEEKSKSYFEAMFKLYLSTFMNENSEVANGIIKSINITSQSKRQRRLYSPREGQSRKLSTNNSQTIKITMSILVLTNVNTSIAYIEGICFDALKSAEFKTLLHFDSYLKDAFLTLDSDDKKQGNIEILGDTRSSFLSKTTTIISCIAAVVVIGFTFSFLQKKRESRRQTRFFSMSSPKSIGNGIVDITSREFMSIVSPKSIGSGIVDISSREKELVQNEIIIESSTRNVDFTTPPFMIRDTVESKDFPGESINKFGSDVELSNRSIQQQVFIPPMLVIDNIDNFEHTSGYDEVEQKTPNINMVKHIEYNSAFAEVLSEKKKTNAIEEYNLFNSYQINTEDIGGSPKSLVSSRASIADTASAQTTPDNLGYENNFSFTPKKYGLHSQNVENDQDDDFNLLFQKSIKAGDRKDKMVHRIKGLFGRTKDGVASHLSCDDEQSSIISFISKEELSDRDGIEDTHDFAYSPVSIPSTEENVDVLNLSCGNDENSNPNVNFEENDETIEKQNQPVNPTHKRQVSELSANGNYCYTFSVQSYGMLGLSIEENSRIGAYVHQVKDYSPFYGLLRPGDKIVIFDSENTSKMNKDQITKLLSSKFTDRSTKSFNVEMTVLSKHYRQGMEPDKTYSSDFFLSQMKEAYVTNNEEKVMVVETDDFQQRIEEIDYDSSGEDCSKASVKDDDCHLLGVDDISDDEDYFCYENEIISCQLPSVIN